MSGSPPYGTLLIPRATIRSAMDARSCSWLAMTHFRDSRAGFSMTFPAVSGDREEGGGRIADGCYYFSRHVTIECIEKGPSGLATAGVIQMKVDSRDLPDTAHKNRGQPV